MLAQEGDDGLDAMILRATLHLASDLFLSDETCGDQPAQVKCQCRCRKAEASLDFADGKTAWASANQQPINIKAGQVAQFGEAACGKFAVHG